MRALLAAALAVLCAAPAFAQAPLFSPTTESRLALTPRQADLLDRTRAESRVVSVVTADVSLLTETSSIRLDVPSGASIPLDARSVTVRQPGDYTWRGGAASISGGIPSSATLVVRKGQITGVIRAGGEVYEVRPLTGGLHAIHQLDLGGRTDHPENYGAFEREERARIEQESRDQPQVNMGAALQRSRGPSTVQIDVLVVYTSEVAAAQADPVAFAQLAIDSANDSYTNTGMDIEVSLSTAYETPTAASNSINNDLTDLRTNGDGRFDEAHAYRDGYGADLVALLGPTTWSGCGLGNLNSSSTTAFTATVYTCAIGNLSFAHEIGHNLGAEHDPPNANSPPAYAYGQGYVNTTGEWRTVMAYSNTCPSGCPRVAYWSDPDVDYPDVTAPIEVGPTGNAATQDNSRLLVERAPTVAAFRVAGDPPVMAYSPSSVSTTVEEEATTSETFTLQNTAASGSTPLGWSAILNNASADEPLPRTAGRVTVTTEPLRAGDTFTPARQLASSSRVTDCTDGETIAQSSGTTTLATSSGGTEYGQSFTASCTGRIEKIAFVVDNGSAPNETWSATMRIYGGEGTSNQLQASSFSWTNGVSGTTTLTLTLGSPVNISQGNVYTWFMDMTAGSSATLTNPSNPDANGSLYTTSDGTPGNASAVAGSDARYRLDLLAPTTPSITWVSLPTNAGSIDAGNSETVTINFDATGLTADTYTADLVLTTNDPTSSSVTIPLSMTVTETGATLAVGDGAGWRLLSMPTASTTVADLASQNLVQGVTNSYPTFNDNLYTGYDGTAWTPASSTADALTPGRGFAWYLFDTDLDPDLGDPNNSASFVLPASLVAPSTASAGDVPVAIHGNGFDLLGNPYRAVLDVSGISGWTGASTLTSFVGQVFTCTPNGASPVACVGSYETTTSLGNTVPVWHGVFFETGTAGTLTIPASAQVASRSATPRLIGFELASATGSALDRAATLVFRDDATPEWDGWDAEKLAPLGTPSVTLAFEGDRDGDTILKAQESRPVTSDGFDVPLSVASEGAGAELVLTWPRLDDIPEDWTLTLTDRLTSESVNLRDAESYVFSVTPSAAREGTQPGATVQSRSASPARFTLSVQTGKSVSAEGDAALVLALDPPRPNPVTAHALIPYTLAEAGPVRLSVLDVLGREVTVLAEGPRPAGAALADWRTDGLAAGLYVLRLEAGGAVKTRQVVVAR